jgi:uncharacterized protein YeaO (DUF488 family)
MSIRTAALGKVDPHFGEYVFLITRWVSRWVKAYIKKNPRWFHVPDLAPSLKLLSALKKSQISWDEYAEGYREEMKSPRAQDLIRRLRKFGDGLDVVLVCYCVDEKHCHRSILLELLEVEDAQSKTRAHP